MKNNTEDSSSTSHSISFSIIQDTREQQPYLFKDVPTIVKKLDTGDYSFEGGQSFITIDRKKSVAEIAQNFTAARFKNEVERMTHIKHSYLMLEFSFNDVLRFPYGSSIPKKKWRYIKIKAPFLIACLTKLSLMGVHIIYAGDRSNAQTITLALLKAAHKMIENELIVTASEELRKEVEEELKSDAEEISIAKLLED